MQRQLDIARVRIEELAARIGAPERWLPSFGHAQDGARPFVLERDGRLTYGYAERGVELDLRQTDDFDELCYWALKDIVSSVAGAWELHHRIEGQDFRILWFGKEMELLDSLDPRWTARWRAEHLHLLRDVGLEPAS